MTDPELHVAPADGRFPNSRLPLLIHRRALPADPSAMREAFARHGWSNAWLNGIFPFHHFHSNTHEVLGIAAGEAHRNMGQSGDLLVVGAYPGGADCDIRRGDPAELDDVTRSIAAVPTPDTDPATGLRDTIRRAWPS